MSGMDSSRVASKSSSGTAVRAVSSAIVAVASLAVACGDPDLVTSVSFRPLGPPAPVAGSCPANGEPVSPFADPNADLVRLTFRNSGDNGFLCDIVLARGEGDQVIAIPSDSADLVDLYVELFSGAPGTASLIASATQHNVAIDANRVVDVPMVYSNTFSCTYEHAETTRAFHSATLLPSGEILLIGGVRAGSADNTIDLEAGGLLYASAEAEIFDPQLSRFRAISIPGLLPRALHRAVLLAGDANEVTIALVGGLTAAGDAGVTPILNSTPGGRTMFSASPGAVGAPVEILTYNSTTSSIVSHIIGDQDGPARRLFASASGSCAGHNVIAGGWSDWSEASALADFEVVDGASGHAVTSAALHANRFGATTTCLADGTALVWGGHLDNDGADLIDYAGEILSGLSSATPIAFSLNYSGTEPSPRAFHSAARTGNDILVVGGYRIAGNAATDPEPVYGQLLARNDANIDIINVPIVGGGSPVAASYLQAVTLNDGDVLTSGGLPAGDELTCPAGLTCSLAAAYRFRATSAEFEPTPGMIVSRYGHRTTAFAGGVLVSGGLHGDDTLRVIADAEVFGTAEEADDPLSDLAPAIERLPGDVARSGDQAVAICAQIE
jgi:hypothetical protein